MPYTPQQITDYARQLGAKGASADEIEAFVASASKDLAKPDSPQRETQWNLLRERGGMAPASSPIAKSAEMAAMDATAQYVAPAVATIAGSPAIGALAASAANSAVQARRELMGEQDGFKKGEAIAAPVSMLASPLGRGALNAVGNTVINSALVGGTEKLRSALDDPQGAPDNAGKAAAIVAAITAASPAIGSVLGRIMNNVAPEEAARIARLATDKGAEDAAIAAIRGRGGVVVPSILNPSPKNLTLEALAGILNTEGEVARRNAPVFNAMARREASMPDIGQQAIINRQNLNTARQGIGDASYDEARRLGFGQQLDNWRGAHTELQRAQEILDQGFTPARGQAVDNATIALRQAEADLNRAANTPDAVAVVENARTRFAKNYDVRQATPEGSGTVSPRALAVMMAQREDGGLTGELADIAKFYNATQRSAKNPANVASGPGAATAGAGVLAAATAHTPAQAATGLVPFLRNPIRNYILSPEYQAANAVRNYTPNTSRNPELDAIMARIAALSQLQNQGRP